MSDVEVETPEPTPERKPRTRKAKAPEALETPASEETQQITIALKPRTRKAKAEAPEALETSAPRTRKAKAPEALETPDPSSAPPRRARKVRVEIPPPEAPALNTDFWGRMLEAHREQQQSDRRDLYASFRIA
jgi:hypothetical protein